MRYDVAGALAQKSRFMLSGESKSLEFATELSKSLHFEPEINSVDSNFFGKCFRVQAREGVALDFYPERDLIVVSSSDFSVSYKSGYMSVLVRDDDGLYISTTESNVSNNNCSIESTFWANDTLEYINSQGTNKFFGVQFDIDKSASDFSHKTVGELYEVDYDSSEFDEHIEKHESVEAAERKRLNSIFKTNDYDSIPGRAKDLNILPDEEKQYVEDRELTVSSAAQIATTVINNPEVVVGDIKKSFTAQSSYSA